MAHHESALKQVRHSEKRRVRNKSHRSHLRSEMKKFRQQVEEGDASAASKSIDATLSMIDHKASLGIIHKNTASRYKSRLTKALNRATTAASK